MALPLRSCTWRLPLCLWSVCKNNSSEKGVSCPQVIESLSTSLMLVMEYIHGFFHGDSHPVNIRIRMEKLSGLNINAKRRYYACKG